MTAVTHDSPAYAAVCHRCQSQGPFERLLEVTQAIAVEFTITPGARGYRPDIHERIPDDAVASEENASIGGYRCTGCGHVHDEPPVRPVAAAV